MCLFFASELGLGSKEGISPVSVPSAITSTVQVKSRPYLLMGPRISDRLGKCMCYSFSINNQRSSFSCCIKGSPQWIIYLHHTTPAILLRHNNLLHVLLLSLILLPGSPIFNILYPIYPRSHLCLFSSHPRLASLTLPPNRSTQAVL